jgi:Mce-associated membrane protein
VNITAVKSSKTTDVDEPVDESDVVSEEARATDDLDLDVVDKGSTPRNERRISLSVRSLSLGVLITALVAALGVMTWLYIGANGNVDAQTQQATDNAHAEQIALDYAVRAAVMDYKDLGPWKRALVDGTTPELGKKLTDAANAMEQILLPLQWSSTAKPIAAKVRSHDNGVYVVDSFVSVMTKTVQAPQDLQSTATYSVTINPADGWKISDVGGIGQVVGDK